MTTNWHHMSKVCVVKHKLPPLTNAVYLSDISKILDFCDTKKVSLKLLRTHFEYGRKLQRPSYFNLYLKGLVESQLLLETGRGTKRKYRTAPAGLTQRLHLNSLLSLTEAPL